MKLVLDTGWHIETGNPLDISIPLTGKPTNISAWYLDAPHIDAVNENGFIGSVTEGGSVNFRNVFFNPHGHTTHTECLGHITPEIHSINASVTNFFSLAQLVSIEPESIAVDGKTDSIITSRQLAAIKWEKGIESLVIRTLPNQSSKKTMNYSSTNPPYLSVDCLEIINELNIQHLLIDTPSVDREEDGGELAFHHGYWGVPEKLNFKRTITELIFVDESIADGLYLLELQIAPFENDASPSRPILYQLMKE